MMDTPHLLPQPAAEAVRAARATAGHTQAQAAAAVGLKRWQTWAEYEGGKPMPPLTFTWYMLATGQHPAAELRAIGARRAPGAARQPVTP